MGFGDEVSNIVLDTNIFYRIADVDNGKPYDNERIRNNLLFLQKNHYLVITAACLAEFLYNQRNNDDRIKALIAFISPKTNRKWKYQSSSSFFPISEKEFLSFSNSNYTKIFNIITRKYLPFIVDFEAEFITAFSCLLTIVFCASAVLYDSKGFFINDEASSSVVSVLNSVFAHSKDFLNYCTERLAQSYQEDKASKVGKNYSLFITEALLKIILEYAKGISPECDSVIGPVLNAKTAVDLFAAMQGKFNLCVFRNSIIPLIEPLMVKKGYSSRGIDYFFFLFEKTLFEKRVPNKNDYIDMLVVDTTATPKLSDGCYALSFDREIGNYMKQSFVANWNFIQKFESDSKRQMASDFCEVFQK